MIMKLDVKNDLPDALINNSYKRVMRLYKKHGEDDDAARGKELVADLQKALVAKYSPPKAGRSKRKK